MKRRSIVFVASLATGLVVIGGTAFARDNVDFGAWRDAQLQSKSQNLFGVGKPLTESSTASVSLAQAQSDPSSLVTLAKGLHARVVTAGTAAANVDQMALWPDGTHPTHLIACNEQGPTDPGLQRIDLATGATATIVTGTSSCDGVRRTAWGTILFSEEASPGQTYELADPLHTTGVTLDRTTGVFSGPGADNLVRRTAVGRMSFEGHGLLPDGVMYYGDENRPLNGTAGGAYFKFVPTTPYTSSSPISHLSQSPLASGRILGLRLGKRNGNTDGGQGTQTGLGTWIPVCDDAGATPCANPDLRAFAATNKLTGYYRPEDLEVDPVALAAGTVKVCGNNTGNEFTDHNWGETICISDGSVAEALAGTAVPEVQYFVLNTSDMAMTDNLAPQFNGDGRWVIVEDGDIDLGNSMTPGKNNDMLVCLPDGNDADTLSDGCIKVGSLNDAGRPEHAEGAEWTGPVFSEDGRHLYVSVQHNITGKGVVLDITGWKVGDGDQ